MSTADRFLVRLFASGEAALIERRVPELYEGLLQLLTADDDALQRMGKLFLLIEAEETPGVTTPDRQLSVDIVNDAVLDLFDSTRPGWRAEAALTAQVTPMLAWLDD